MEMLVENVVRESCLLFLLIVINLWCIFVLLVVIAVEFGYA